MSGRVWVLPCRVGPYGLNRALLGKIGIHLKGRRFD